METATTTITLPLNNLYYLTADPNNQTGYTLEEIQSLIDEKGAEYKIEATITHPVPPTYTVERDINAHRERIKNSQKYLVSLKEELSQLENETEKYVFIEEQIVSINKDITYCEEYIKSLENS